MSPQKQKHGAAAKPSAASTPKRTSASNASSTTTSPGGQGGRGAGQEAPAESDEGGEMYYCVPWVEACALVTMCSYRSVTRRLSLVLLKEIRSLHAALQIEVCVCATCVCACVRMV